MPLLSRIGSATARGFGLFVGKILDPYYKYVTLLLHGDGTNGAQNNTFLDSSTNNFTITRNGNTTQGTFTPYGPNWSNYFGANSANRIDAGANAAFAFGTGAFTVEAWIFIYDLTAENFVFDTRSSVSTAGVGFSIEPSTGKLRYSGSANNVLTTTAITANTWNHIAWVYNGTTLTGYINGVSGGTATPSFNITQNNGQIGNVPFASVSTSAYLSNVRVVKGTAVYSGTFTPSTTPLTAISGTSLLTCQSNRFVDNSSNAFALTVSGSPTIQRFSPFSPSAAYSTSVIGGSGYFDGSGDYLSTANGVTNVGTGDVCVECWVYYTGTYADYNFIFDSRAGSPFTDGFAIAVNITNGYFYFSQASQEILTSIVCQKNTWYHVCVTRQSGVFRLFVNGVLGGTYTSSSNLSSTSNRIGWYYGATASYQFPGYISDLRATKSAVPTSYQTSSTTVGAAIFTPPTAPLTTTSQGASGTSLLLNYTNGGIYDNAMMNDLETVGSAQVSTTQVKFGTGSMSFNGSTDKLIGRTSPNLNMGSGDFTVECWVYWGGTSTLYQNFVGSNSASFTGNATFFRVWGTSAGVLANKVGIGNPTHDAASSVYSVNSLVANTWTHVAATRSSGIIRVFINGTLERTGSSDTSTYDFGDNGICVGQSPWDGANGWYSGYIDDMRITKGYARYTSNFSVPTSAFPNQ